MPQSPTCHAPGGRDSRETETAGSMVSVLPVDKGCEVGEDDPLAAKIGRQEADSMATCGGPRRAGRYCTRSAQSNQA